MYKYLILLCCIFLSINIQAQNSYEKLDSFLTLLEEHDKFMGSVAIRQGLNLKYSKAVGWASIKDSMPNRTNTKFRIGSVSKVFTASMIFQLIEEQALTLKTPLSRFYQDIPNADSITIDHLLAHRTGIHNITEDDDFKDYMELGTTREEMIDRIIEKGSDFPPGTQTQYSNTNYILLGYILEILTDRTYGKLLQNRVCRPLDLKDTYLEDSTELKQNENYSYRYTGKRWVQLPETDMSIPHGAGAIVSTAKDLTTFIYALFDLRLISEKSLQRMTATQDVIGRGLFRYMRAVDTAFGHGGAIDGFYTQLFYYPGKNISIALCTNGLNYRNEKLLAGLVDIYFNRPFQIPQFMRLEEMPDTTAMKAYTGYFTCDNFPMDIELFLKNEQIYGQATGQSSFPLSWESVDILTFPAAKIVIDFTKSELKNGQFQSFIFTQGSPAFHFTRKSE